MYPKGTVPALPNFGGYMDIPELYVYDIRSRSHDNRTRPNVVLQISVPLVLRTFMFCSIYINHFVDEYYCVIILCPCGTESCSCRSL